ncbi:F-type H+-transporting ATPase subunit a [Nakamurella panacisegetis]|uniref:ATP synthase subunit a n=1 Tax=Nakamurella panacisegetis TaxID=1090615 RepID=A0A1H0SQC8_9ACTN|nr:F0F1 ATP synthase subunit A [Nakamurella panacisegetis]SDP43438.1 F-type H+-transporting ATPase subunit a [Nakamurella panacisegetis]
MSLSLLLAASDSGAGFTAPSVQESFFFDQIGNGKFIASIKVMLLLVLGVVLIIGFFAASAKRAAVVPGKLQFVGESLYGFVRNGVAIEILGKQGKKWAGFLATLFVFVLVMNLWELIPVAQVPVTSHFAIPVFLAVMVWFIYNVVGIRKHGFFGYLKLMCYIPGIPVAMHLLLIPIEFLSNIILRPFTMAVRLFANMFAGHMLVGVAAAGAIFLFEQGGISYGTSILPFAASIFLVFFELLICGLQAYVFTLLAAIYLESSLADSH